MAHLSGRYNTHIANATKYEIFARVDDNEQPTQNLGLAELSVKVKTEKVDFQGNSKLKYEKKTEYFEKKPRSISGFQTIKPGEFKYFPSDNPHVSVFYKTGNGLGQVICNAMRIAPDNSIIVTPTGIVASVYGDIWEKRQGKDGAGWDI